MKTHPFLLALVLGLLVPGLAPRTIAAASDKEAESAPLVAGLDDLRELDHKLVAMAAKAVPATVALMSPNGGAGSGVVVSSEGLILSAAHVVAALSDEAIVIFPDGTRRTARALGADFDRDAAMLRINEAGPYPHVEVDRGESLLRNEWCVALGHPGGYDPMRTPPLRLGRVLHSGRFLITDCAVVGGDSGGPLFDAEGRVVGIHSNIGVTLSQNRHVPIAVFLERWDDLEQGKRTGRAFKMDGKEPDPNRPVMGVRFEGLDSPQLRIAEVMKNSPAERAGLQAGDVITMLNGRPFSDLHPFMAAVGEFEPGTRVELGYEREGETRQVRVKLARFGDVMGEGATPDQQPPDQDEKSAAKNTKPAKDQEEGDLLSELIERALRNKGRLELKPGELKQLGGLDKLMEKLRENPDAPEAEGLRKLLEGLMLDGPFQADPDEFFASSMKALEPVTRKSAGATVEVLVNGKPVALGTVMSEEGWVLTKETETREGEVSVRMGEDEHAATLVRRFPDHDLALFDIATGPLHPARLITEDEPPLGSLLAVSNAGNEPIGIGLVSVRTRRLGEVGFLGMMGGESDQGVLVEQVVKDGPAAKAGLRKGDIIKTLDGEVAEDSSDFGRRIRTRLTGETVTLGILRGEKDLTLEVKLGPRPDQAQTKRFRRMNQMSGPLSKKLGGFPRVLQHDIPLKPSECGGPLLDLEGRCVGINVSRAGRVKTYAIPALEIGHLLAEVREELAAKKPATPPSTPPATNPAEDADLKAILEALDRIRGELDAIEKQLGPRQGR